MPIIGHQKIWDKLIKTQASQRLGNAYLLTGPEAIGKATLVQTLAKVWLCDQNNSCGKCAACQQVAASVHLDLHLLLNDGEPIKIETVRLLQQRLSQTSVSALRLVLIADAERLTLPAANALLKLLEEPPARTTIFLTTAKPAELLGTVRSRCRLLALTDVVSKDLQDGLIQLGFAPEDITKLQNELPYLRPGEYIQCLRDPGAWQERQALDQIAKQFLAENRLAQNILSGEVQLSSNEKLHAFLATLLRLIHWLLKTEPSTRLAQLASVVMQAQLDLTNNVNRRLIWESLVLSKCC